MTDILLIELMTSEPFAPFDLPAEPTALHAAALEVAPVLGFDDQDVLTVRHAVEAARAAQKGSRMPSVVAFGAAGAAAALLPLVGVPALAAAGAAGAASITSGLAALGGGSMMTGMLVLSSASAVSTGVAALVVASLSPAQMIVHVVQLHARALVLDGRGDAAGAREVVERIRAIEFEARRMSDEHDAVDEGSDGKDAQRTVAVAAQRALDVLGV